VNTREVPKILSDGVGYIERKSAPMESLSNCHQHRFVELLSGHAHQSHELVNLVECQMLLFVAASDGL
jgi:hypothetical protein